MQLTQAEIDFLVTVGVAVVVELLPPEAVVPPLVVLPPDEVVPPLLVEPLDLVVLPDVPVLAVVVPVVVVPVPLDAVLVVPLDLVVLVLAVPVVFAAEVDVLAAVVAAVVPLAVVAVLLVVGVAAVVVALDVAATVATAAVLAAAVVVCADVSVVLDAAVVVVAALPRSISPITADVFTWLVAVVAAVPPSEPQPVRVRQRTIEVAAALRLKSALEPSFETVTYFRRRSAIRNTRLSQVGTESVCKLELRKGHRPVSGYPFVRWTEIYVPGSAPTTD